MRVRGLKGLVIVFAVGGVVPVEAQNSFAPAVEPNQWEELSPDTRNEMRRRYLENLSPTKREELRTQVQRFNSMSPPKKREICRRFEEDRGYLPPACKKLF